MSVDREQFSSKIGFVLAAAGSAVGIGNLVGFPVAAAKNGGGAFLLVYALFVVFLCLPIMMAELTIGRTSSQDPSSAYRVLGGKGVWSIAGILGVLTPFMVGVFYLVITLWLLGYFVAVISGDLHHLANPEYFSNFIQDPHIFYYLAGTVATIFFILAGGVKDGIERTAKLLMPALFVMLVGLVGYALTLPNASAGVEFYLVPDFAKIDAKVVSGALAQAFFSLSLGMGILITYGSYMNRQTDVKQSARFVALTDTAVAFFAGLLILPAIFSFDPSIDPSTLSESSVSLIFTFLPKIFLALEASLGYTGASVIAGVFFALVLVAAITSMVSIVEVPLASLARREAIGRKKAIFILAIILGAFAIPAAASFGMVDYFSQFVSYAGANKSVFDIIYDVFYDTILPLNGLLACLFVLWKWKYANFAQALNEGSTKSGWYDTYMKFAMGTFIPLVLLAIFVNTVCMKFFGFSLV